jgi:hypothetical protein
MGTVRRHQNCDALSAELAQHFDMPVDEITASVREALERLCELRLVTV